MTDNIQTVANVGAAFDAFADLTSSLTDDQWAVQSTCPDWDVRGVAMHIASIEHALSGWFPSSDEDPPPFKKAGEFQAENADLSGAELHARMLELFDSRKAELAALDAAQLDLPSLTPVGLQTYGRFMAIRVFDIWIHEQDIRYPLGQHGHEGGPVAAQALEEIHNSLGYIAGKKIGLEDGQSITFDLTGPVEAQWHVAVDGRAALVDSLDDPTVVLSADSTTFAMLACGRIDPEQQIADGKISWTGDDEIGARAARNLRFTM